MKSFWKQFNDSDIRRMLYAEEKAADLSGQIRKEIQ